MLDPDDPEALQVIHTNDLELSRIADPASGILAIALLVWADKTNIAAVHQTVYFDQKLEIKKDKAGKIILRFYAVP